MQVLDSEEVKRKRYQNACDACRRRKVRCDSASSPENICSNCISSQLKCTHALVKKKRGPRGVATKKTESQRALVNAILSSSKPFVIPDDPEAIRKMLVDLANFARSLDRQLSLARTSEESQLFDPLTSTSSPLTSEPDPEPEPEPEQDLEDSVNAITQDLQNMVVHFSNRHFGKSSYFGFLQSAIVAQGDNGLARPPTAAVFARFKRPELWNEAPWQRICQGPDIGHPLLFPEIDLLHSLVALFFNNFNVLLPLLHRPTFERSVAAGLHLHDRSFGFVVLAVCAVASRHSDDPRNLWDGTTSPYSLGWKWFTQIPLIRGNFLDQPTLYDIQLCVLNVYFLRTTSAPDAVWTIVGLGIRHAQEMGMHRKKPKDHKHTIEDELCNRAFWSLVVMDFTMSIGFGRPSITNPNDYDIDFPVECDDEYWEHPTEPFRQPEGKPSTASFFRAYCKLAEIAASVQRALVGVHCVFVSSKYLLKAVLRQEAVIIDTM
ncbi:Gypsy retrotransposon integrase-like protein 1 [Paramarasmius palmivorus]|uniref:Gypsy retrotransposon integrase-like protein 1 n=1 Tax=Paramarasmius palmivorus TaxID=297713 RepID=A0AAW0B2H4_9AGAR